MNVIRRPRFGCATIVLDRLPAGQRFEIDAYPECNGTV